MNEESGWVIEKGDSEVSRPKYWIGFVQCKSQWSFDNLKAIRFARRDDALAIRTCVEADHRWDGTHRVAEHGWGP